MVTVLSPLRYPGAKRRLFKNISTFLESSGIRPGLFVEPFAGGAGVSLQLLGSGMTEKVALGDLDPLVASFWKVLFFDTEWLLNQLEDLEVSVDTWKRFKGSEYDSDRKRALACLFLNRTSFSGILAAGAGPIGGYEQRSDYKIDCRFNRKMLARRIRLISTYRDRIDFVDCLDWKETTLRAMEHKKDSLFFYFDPPFFRKAHRLYRHYFEDADHKKLRDFLCTFRGDWLLSYDDAESFRKLYDGPSFQYSDVKTLYSASTINGRGAGNEVLVTNVKIGQRLSGKKIK